MGVNFGPISGVTPVTTVESSLVTGLTISRVLQLRSVDTNTSDILVRPGPGLTPFKLVAGQSVEVDTQYGLTNIQVSAAINGQTITYMSKYIAGE